MRILTVWLVFLTISLLSHPSHAEAGRRLALVVGNSQYEGAPRLPNPANDADDVATALKALGFEVRLDRDVRKDQFEQDLKWFAGEAQNADAALFYYAGHGLQFDNENYLVPVDAKLQNAAAVPFELIDLDTIRKSLDGAHGPRLIILDACRDDPLLVKLKESMPASRSTSLTRGLARMNADPGTLVAYSTQAGRTAVDGTGRNSPFTAAFLAETHVPGLEIGVFFRRVAAAVSEATGGEQLPEVSISLTAEFYLSPPASPGSGAPAPAPDVATGSSDLDRQTQLALWNAATHADKAEGYEAYLSAYPSGIFAQLARLELAKRKEELAAAVVPPKPAVPTKPAAPPAPEVQTPLDVENALGLATADKMAVEVSLLRQKANPGTVDGFFDSETRSAIRSWQYMEGYDSTGYLTRNELEKLVPKSGAKVQNIATVYTSPPPDADERLTRVVAALQGQTYTYTVFGGHLYVAVTVKHGGNGISFADARKLAEDAGGHLVTITSSAENKAVFNLIKDDPRFWWFGDDNYASGSWIGYYQAPGSRSSRSGWTWIGGTSKFTNWDRGQPNEIELGAGPGAAAFGGGFPGKPVPTWQDQILMKQNAPGFIIEFE